MISSPISTKSIARIAAIQTMYKFASNKDERDIASVLIRIKEFYKDEHFKSDHEIETTEKLKLKPSITYLEELVKYTHENIDEIDKLITIYLTNEWTISSIPILLRAVLRVAIAEINYFPETPRKVVINEYTDIAGDMLDEKEVGFVNSVLHNYSNSKQ